jgi:hypothetical protein
MANVVLTVTAVAITVVATVASVHSHAATVVTKLN